MAFDKFKAKHGGLGPLAAFYSGATEGRGVFGNWRPRVVEEQWDETFDAINADDSLDSDFKQQMAGLRNGNYAMPEKQQIMAAVGQRVRDVKTINTAHDLFGQQQARLRSATMTHEDRAQLDVMDTQAELARRYMLSGNPELQALGREMSSRVMQSQQAFATTNEAQNLAAETAYGTEKWSRFTGAYDDLYRESAPFLEIQRSYRVLHSAYSGKGEPGNANDLAAINSLQRMIDPGATVRDGDVALLQNLAGVPEWLITAANRVAKNGGRFTPEERRELIGLGDRIMGAANEGQTSLNARFQELGTAAELPPKLQGQLAIPLSDTGAGSTGLNYGTPVPAGGAIKGDLSPTSVLHDTAVGVGDIYEGARNAVSRGFDVLGGELDTDEYQPHPPGPREDGATFQGLPVSRDGMVRGVYVPWFMRDGARGAQ